MGIQVTFDSNSKKVISFYEKQKGPEYSIQKKRPDPSELSKILPITNSVEEISRRVVVKTSERATNAVLPKLVTPKAKTHGKIQATSTPRTIIEEKSLKEVRVIVVPQKVIEKRLEEVPSPNQETKVEVVEQQNIFEKSTIQVIDKTALVVEKNPDLKKLVAFFAGCHLDHIHFTPPGMEGRKEHIVTPALNCVKKSAFGCQTAHVTCETPPNSVFPLVSGFANINGADWATTDLKPAKAEFLMECDVYNRWTYISDIPGIDGVIYPTNEIFCLLVPNLTASSSNVDEEEK